MITFMSVEVTCGKCGEKITNMKMLKSLKDVMNPYNGKCPIMWTETFYIRIFT